MTLTKSGSVEYAATPLEDVDGSTGSLDGTIDINVDKLLRSQRAILTIRNLMIADLDAGFAMLQTWIKPEDNRYDDITAITRAGRAYGSSLTDSMLTLLTLMTSPHTPTAKTSTLRFSMIWALLMLVDDDVGSDRTADNDGKS